MPSMPVTRLNQEAISKLDLNEIGDNEITVTEIQAQLNAEKENEKKKESMK